jgi:hypothetical protein
LRLFAELVAGQAREFYGVPHEPDPLVEITALMLAGGLSEVLLAWLDGTVKVTREQLIEDCADLFEAVGQSAFDLVRRRAG